MFKRPTTRNLFASFASGVNAPLVENAPLHNVLSLCFLHTTQEHKNMPNIKNLRITVYSRLHKYKNVIHVMMDNHCVFQNYLFTCA